MSAEDTFIEKVLLKCAALRQRAAVRVARDLMTAPDTGSALQALMKHTEVLTERIGRVFCTEATYIRQMSDKDRRSWLKHFPDLIRALVAGLDGKFVKLSENYYNFEHGPELNAPAIIKSARNPTMKTKLQSQWDTALSAMIKRQNALFRLAIDHTSDEQQKRSNEVKEVSVVAVPEVPDPSKDSRCVRLIEASTRFNIPKSSLSKALRIKPPDPRHLPHIRKDRQVWLFVADVRRLARTREAYHRRTPPE